jgi:hypothetical protein
VTAGTARGGRSDEDKRGYGKRPAVHGCPSAAIPARPFGACHLSKTCLAFRRLHPFLATIAKKTMTSTQEALIRYISDRRIRSSGVTKKVIDAFVWW